MENVGDDEKGKKCSIDLFRYAAYEERKKISYDCLINVFRNSIESVVLTNVSSECKNFKGDCGKILYQRLEGKSEWLADFLDMKYINVFFDYYYKEEKPLKMINFKGITINLSKNTKTIKDLLSKNINMKNEMIDVVKNIYLNECGRSKKFIT